LKSFAWSLFLHPFRYLLKLQKLSWQWSCRVSLSWI